MRRTTDCKEVKKELVFHSFRSHLSLERMNVGVAVKRWIEKLEFLFGRGCKRLKVIQICCPASRSVDTIKKPHLKNSERLASISRRAALIFTTYGPQISPKSGMCVPPSELCNQCSSYCPEKFFLALVRSSIQRMKTRISEDLNDVFACRVTQTVLIFVHQSVGREKEETKVSLRPGVISEIGQIIRSSGMLKRAKVH